MIRISKIKKIVFLFIFLIIIIWSLTPKIIEDIHLIKSIKISVLVDSLNSGYDEIIVTKNSDINVICNMINKSPIKYIDIWSTDALQKDYNYSLVLNYYGFKANEVIYIEKDGTILTYLYGNNEGYISALNPQFINYLDNYISNTLF